MWKRRMKKEKFKDMVREELQALLTEHGLTEDYTLQLLEETIRKAKDKGDVTNLMRAVDNVSSAKKFIKDGRGSLYSKAEEMKKLGANSKKELN